MKKEIINVHGIYLNIDLRKKKTFDTCFTKSSRNHSYLHYVETIFSFILSKIRYDISLWGSIFPIQGRTQDKFRKTANKQ